jgi:hypothetical protein
VISGELLPDVIEPYNKGLLQSYDHTIEIMGQVAINESKQKSGSIGTHDREGTYTAKGASRLECTFHPCVLTPQDLYAHHSGTFFSTIKHVPVSHGRVGPNLGLNELN